MENWEAWLGQLVVVDTDSTYVYLGTLAEVKGDFILLRDVDAHDRNDGYATKERYIMDAKQYGLKPNRKEVSIRRDKVVSVSRLADVIGY